MTTRTVPGFLPSTSGFAFANDFPKVPVRHIGIPGVVSVPIGDASNGLCGGMAFAARDYFEARMPPPADTTTSNRSGEVVKQKYVSAPSARTPRYGYRNGNALATLSRGESAWISRTSRSDAASSGRCG